MFNGEEVNRLCPVKGAHPFTSDVAVMNTMAYADYGMPTMRRNSNN